MVERHPDNITAALFGGFIGASLSELDAEDMARREIPLSEVLPEPAGGEDTGKTPPIPPIGIGHFETFPLAKEIKAIVVIPDFKVDTADARKVLPDSYSRADAVCPPSKCEIFNAHPRFRYSTRSVWRFCPHLWAPLRPLRSMYIERCRIASISLTAESSSLGFQIY